jgi:hypothetical protein
MFEKNRIVAAGLASILALGSFACTATSTSTTEVSTSTTDADGNTTTTTTKTENGETTTETKTEAATSATTDDVIDVSTWKNAWMGKSSTGYDVYYAESNEGESDSMLVVRNADKNEAESFIGKATSKEQNVITIDTPTHTFTFGIEGATEGEESVTLDLGEQYGTAELKRCSIDDILSAIRAFDTNHDILA